MNHTVWIEYIEKTFSPWVYAPVFAFVCAFGFWHLKNIIIHQLKAWSSKVQSKWYEILVESVILPLNLLILASSLTVLINLLPLTDKVNYMVKIVLQASVIFSIVFFLDQLIRVSMNNYANNTVFSQVSHGVTKSLIRGFIIGVGALVFLDLIGISITPVLASLGVGSLAVALALQDTLSNFFAGLYITIDKPVKEGDFIKLETGEEGYVLEVGWRSTRLQMPSNNVVIIPNSKLIGSVIVNYCLPEKALAVSITMGVSYESDLDQVEKITLEVARQVMKEIPGAVPNFEPSVRFQKFGESSLDFIITLKVSEFSTTALIKHEFIKRLHVRYRQEGIVIPFPVRTLDLPEKFYQKVSSSAVRQQEA